MWTAPPLSAILIFAIIVLLSTNASCGLVDFDAGSYEAGRFAEREAKPQIEKNIYGDSDLSDRLKEGSTGGYKDGSTGGYKDGSTGGYKDGSTGGYKSNTQGWNGGWNTNSYTRPNGNKMKRKQANVDIPELQGYQGKGRQLVGDREPDDKQLAALAARIMADDTKRSNEYAATNKYADNSASEADNVYGNKGKRNSGLYNDGQYLEGGKLSALYNDGSSFSDNRRQKNLRKAANNKRNSYSIDGGLGENAGGDYDQGYDRRQQKQVQVQPIIPDSKDSSQNTDLYGNTDLYQRNRKAKIQRKSRTDRRQLRNDNDYDNSQYNGYDNKASSKDGGDRLPSLDLDFSKFIRAGQSSSSSSSGSSSRKLSGSINFSY